MILRCGCVSSPFQLKELIIAVGRHGGQGGKLLAAGRGHGHLWLTAVGHRQQQAWAETRGCSVLGEETFFSSVLLHITWKRLQKGGCAGQDNPSYVARGEFCP